MSDTMDVGFKKSATGETLYEGGAQRDSRVGKGAPEWMPSQAISLVSCIYEAGNKGRSKTGNGDDRNWENGMKIGDLLGSALRHIERYREGDRSEAHLPQAIWNLLNALQMAIWVSTGYRSASFNNLADHINPWVPGDPPPPALSLREIDWLKLRGINVGVASRLNASYLAAMVDAEGTISIVKREAKRKESYYTRVSIYNSNKELLETIKSRFGGSVILARKATNKHAAAWVLVWSHASAADIARITAPMLTIKAAQADIAVRFQALASSNTGRAGLPASTLEQMREMKSEINRLNLKNKSEPEDFEEFRSLVSRDLTEFKEKSMAKAAGK
jgi:hypothetical protein